MGHCGAGGHLGCGGEGTFPSVNLKRCCSQRKDYYIAMLLPCSSTSSSSQLDACLAARARGRVPPISCRTSTRSSLSASFRRSAAVEGCRGGASSSRNSSSRRVVWTCAALPEQRRRPEQQPPPPPPPGYLGPFVQPQHPPPPQQQQQWQQQQPRGGNNWFRGGPLPPQPPLQPPPEQEQAERKLSSYVNAVIAAAFVAGLGLGVYFDSEVNVSPSNVSNVEYIDRNTPNAEICMANGYSASVFDMKLYVTFNP